MKTGANIKTYKPVMYKLSEQDSVAILNPKNEWLECPYWPQSIERDTSQLQIDTLRWTNVTFIYGKNLLFWMLESHNATFLLKKTTIPCNTRVLGYCYKRKEQRSKIHVFEWGDKTRLQTKAKKWCVSSFHYTKS